MRRIGLALALVLALLLVFASCVSDRRPESAPTAAADSVARQVEQAVNVEAWARTGAVKFTFAGKHEWLWDRAGSRARLRNGDLEVLFRTTDRGGVAFEKGQPQSGPALEAALADAWKSYCNDTFWLNPLAKLFDDGVKRSLVPVAEGHTGLLVEYTSGGVTPGDAYLWHVGADNRPVAWQMWVSVIPVGGMRMGWSEWQTLETGALVSTLHESGVKNLRLTDVVGKSRLDDLEPAAFDRLPAAH